MNAISLYKFNFAWQVRFWENTNKSAGQLKITTATRCSGSLEGHEILRFTKKYVVGFSRADLDIPKQSWNFVGSQPGHSKSNIEFLC